MRFNRFFSNEELETSLTEWSEKYRQIFSLGTLGKSYEGRSIFLVTLTNRETGGDLEKPAIWIDGNIHATELAATTTLLHFLHTVIEGYGRDDRITRLLDTAVYYVSPRLNPDGAELAMAREPRYLRSGVRPYPWEDQEPGLCAEDIDGDGRILQMRVPDPSGDWKVSSLDPRLMEKRGPDEDGGEYYRVFPEGKIHEYDGDLIRVARPLESLDFNRNFPFEWRPEAEQYGAGPFPTSEPEIRALVEFISGHRNINLALTYHTCSGVILRPYSTKSDEQMKTDDLWIYKQIGKRGSDLTGYDCISVFHGFKYHPERVETGAFDDWLFDHFGMFAFTVELWDLPRRAGIEGRDYIEWMRGHPHEDDLKILNWIDQHAPEGYCNWYPFEHSQLGRVELGGLNEFMVWKNPPPGYLTEEAARNTPFMISIGEMVPRIKVRSLSVTELGAERWQVKAVVENTGYLSTCTSVQGRTKGSVRGVRAEIEVPEGVTLLSGLPRIELGHLEGRSNKHSVAQFRATSATDNRGKAEWVLRGPEGATVGVVVRSERAGTVREEVVLSNHKSEIS